MQGSITERIKKKGKDSQGRLRSNIKVYDVRYRYKDSNTGEWKQSNKRGFITKSEAEKFLLEINHKFETNTFVLPKVILLKEYLHDWLDHYVEINLRSSTYFGYKRIIEKHIIPYVGNVDLKNLTANHIDKIYAHLLKDGRSDGKGGLSAKTVLYTHRVFNEALKHALKKRLIHYNPMTGITNIPKPKKFKSNIYKKEEILNLLEIVRGTVYEIPIALAAVCGLRRGECLALTRDDIDFENQTIRINKQYNDVNNITVLGDPKSEDSNRIISAPKEVFDIIKARMQVLDKNKILLKDQFEDNNLIVCQENGKLIRPIYFTKNFSNLIKRYKLKHIRFHDLRHSCASLMLKSGVAMKTASQILGHSTIGITADLYTHVLEDSKKEAALQVGKELFRKSKP